MFERAGRGGSWKRGALTSLLAAFVLLLQAVAATPCDWSKAAAASDAAAAAHCAEMAPHEPQEDGRTPASDAGGCCDCLASAGATPLPASPRVTAACASISADRLRVHPKTPALRAIASGPPSQAPPARI